MTHAEAIETIVRYLLWYDERLDALESQCNRVLNYLCNILGITLDDLRTKLNEHYSATGEIDPVFVKFDSDVSALLGKRALALNKGTE